MFLIVYTYEVSADSLVEGETLTIQIANTTMVTPDDGFNFISEFSGTGTYPKLSKHCRKGTHHIDIFC